MKPRFYISAYMAIAILASCTPKTEKIELQAEDFRTRIEKCGDTDSLRILVEQAVAHAQTLADRGRTGEADLYLCEIQEALANKTQHQHLSAYFDSAKATVRNLPAAPADTTAQSDTICPSI